MKKETIQATLQLLKRVQLTGEEVPAYVQIITELQMELQKGEPSPPIEQDPET